MTLTKRQRDALKVALDNLKETEVLMIVCKGNWNSDDEAVYAEHVAAMQTIEEMLRGVQGELDFHGEGVA